MYDITVSQTALQELSHISPPDREMILKKTYALLSSSPYPHGKNPKKLKGLAGYRLRIGDYRVLYTIEKSTVKIYLIAHRKDVYR